jgi:predicted transcriptional regulator of viral defense system
MYVDRALAGSYLVHLLPAGKASPNITVLDKAKQLGTKYWYFLHSLTLFALVSVKSSKVQGTEAQHANAKVQATTHIFQSLSKARSTSLGVLNAKALLSGPRGAGLHQN